MAVAVAVAVAVEEEAAAVEEAGEGGGDGRGDAPDDEGCGDEGCSAPSSIPAEEGGEAPP